MAGRPSPTLSSRIRSAIAQPPAARSHYWIAAAAACVIPVLTLGGAGEQACYAGSTDFKTGYTKLQEAQQVQDFEGVVQWGIGLSGSTCYRVYLLTGPDRVVIDAETGT